MRTFLLILAAATTVTLSGPVSPAASPQSAPSTVQDRVDLLLFEGELLLEEGKTLEAIDNFTEVVTLDPDRLDGHLLLARALTSALLSGEVSEVRETAAEAMNHYRWVLRREPDNIEASEGEKLLRTRFFSPEGGELSSEEARRAWTEGQDALTKGDFEAAARAFERAARAEPQSWSVRHAWAEALEKAGEPKKALKAYQEAVERNPRHPELHVGMGRVLESLGRGKEALEEYGQALDLPGNHDEATEAILRLLEGRESPPLSTAERGLLGRAHVEAENLDKAIAILEPLVKDHPEPGFRKALATAYFLASRDEPAEALFSELQGESPHDTEVLYYLAALHLRRGDMEKGRGFLRSVLAIDPQDASALRLLGLSLSDEPGQEREALNLLLRAEASGASIEGLSCILGTLYLRVGLPHRAQGEFLYCLGEKPEFPGAHLGLGLIADDMGRKGDAIEHLQQYLALEPDPEPSAIFRLGVAYLRSGKDAQGFEALRRLVSIRADSTQTLPPPTDVDLLEMTSFFLATVRRFDDAAFIGEMLLTRNPQNAVYNNNLAMTYADAETNLERALQLAEKANRLDPQNPGHMDTLGWALLRLQRFSEAESTLVASARLADTAEAETPSEIYYHLGVLYHLTERPTEAMDALTRAGENPPSPYLRDEIRKLLDEVTRGEGR